MNSPVPSLQVQKPRIDRIFQMQFDFQYELARRTARERLARLDRFEQVLLRYREEIKEAMRLDFGKHPFEVDMTELFVITHEIRQYRRSLRRWLKPQPAGTPLHLLGSRSHILYEPKGLVLIMSPWNFPINLTFAPMVSAIAAGNCVILKPSEVSRHSSAVMEKIVAEAFEEREVALIQGDVQVAQALLEKPFNHIFFTGSTEVGKKIMAAASQHLASVTLELGGKSPTIVDAGANLRQAARRIAMAKFANVGQMCISPDHVFVHRRVKDAFLSELVGQIESCYGKQAELEPSYARIVSPAHFRRLDELLQEARKLGAKVAYGGRTEAGQKFIEPTLVTEVPPQAGLMKEEIFGPILPILTFDRIDEPIAFIRQGAKPLALYIYSRNRRHIRTILAETRAGTTAVNNSAVHFYNTQLPFGGSNASGIGNAHGLFSFFEFTNPRAVYDQKWPSGLDLLRAPYGKWNQKMADIALRWL